jgi:hypothetical protein
VLGACTFVIGFTITLYALWFAKDPKRIERLKAKGWTFFNAFDRIVVNLGWLVVSVFALILTVLR